MQPPSRYLCYPILSSQIYRGKKAEKKFCLPWDYLNDDHADNSLDSTSVETGSSVHTLPHEPSAIVATNITIAITITSPHSVHRQERFREPKQLSQD